MDTTYTKSNISTIKAPEKEMDNANSFYYWQEKLFPFLSKKYKHIRITFNYYELNNKRTILDKIFFRNYTIQKQFTSTNSINFVLSENKDSIHKSKLRVFLCFGNEQDFFKRNPVTKEGERIPNLCEMKDPNWMVSYVDILFQDIVEISLTKLEKNNPEKEKYK